MTQRELTCVTWNIHGGVGTDGRELPARYVEVLQRLDADVVALQEVDCRRQRAGGGDKLEWLAEQTGLSAIAGPARREAGGYFGNALLTRLPIAEVKHLNISVRGHEPRSVLEAVLRSDAGELQVFVTHFGLRAAERAQQAGAMLACVCRRPELPALVMGDFNEWRPRARTIGQLNAVLGRAPAVRSFPARLPLLTLDRVWVRPRQALRHVHAYRDAVTKVASDHLPVVAQVRL